MHASTQIDGTMAPPSNKSTLLLIAVLVVLAATTQPSAATTRGAVVRASKTATSRPQFFFPPFPIPTCVPGFPRWLLPCVDRPAPAPYEEPKECRSPLMTMASPCGKYLTDAASVASPPAACCDSFKAIVDNASICVCHIGNGDIGQLLTAPLNFTQLYALPGACRSAVRLDGALAHCDMSEVPPMTPLPPTPAARKTPPPSPLPPDTSATECWTPLMIMVPPCTEYLTNASVASPPGTCCDSFKTIVYNYNSFCLCHVGNGDIGQLLPSPLNFTQLYALPHACRSHVPLDGLLAHCDMSQVPPMTPPSPTPTGKASPSAP